ncbi:hypothetical protein TSUD_402550 [Trifolium subterraneum]|uniref:Uncharacterized protein n=1 Tax=Trifolium subterraneum TaxID=3900 RepID=A0A2Z6PC92_TRISU|nr:hypothetical protein TSUD_402550 [Trifolium subterraneum]
MDNSVSNEIESVFLDSEFENFVVHEYGKENGGEKEVFVSKESESNFREIENKNFVSMENGYYLCDDSMKVDEEKEEEKEIEGDDILEIESNVREDGCEIDENETEYSVFIENDTNEDGEKIVEKEIEDSVSKDSESNLRDVSMNKDEIEKENFVFRDESFDLHDSKRAEETEQETGDSVFVESDSIKTITSKYEFFAEKDISCFVEEPTALRFSFREFYASPNVSSISNNEYKEFSKLDLEKDFVTEKQEEKDESIHSNDVPFRFESEMFGVTDSSDEDYFIFNENSVTSDSESESSCSSGLIWGNNTNNKIDDSFSYRFLGSEKFESEIRKLMMRDEKIEGLEENQSSFDDKVSKFEADFENEYIEIEHEMKGLKSFEEHGFEVKDKKEVMKKSEEAKWEEELNESESDEDDFEWEHEEIVEQLKLELKNSRQGGLATIIEEVEDEEEQDEKESPKVFQEFKPMKIEVKLVEHKDQINEIDKVYKSYAEKMRKLDILNYQTMHALDDSKGGEEDPIASGRLQDIIKESMRVFWEFVRADNKDNGNLISKEIGSDLKDPVISNLLVDIRTQLLKKERKLKDIVRSGNCIVKKFQKHHEDQLDHEQLVAQVGLKLISRVKSQTSCTWLALASRDAFSDSFLFNNSILTLQQRASSKSKSESSGFLATVWLSEPAARVSHRAQREGRFKSRCYVSANPWMKKGPLAQRVPVRHRRQIQGDLEVDAQQ